jgi:GAF domain-containing protein
MSILHSLPPIAARSDAECRPSKRLPARALRNLLATLSDQNSLRDLLQSLPDALAEFFNAERCSIILGDAGKSGEVASLFGACQAEQKETYTSLAVRQVLSSGESLLIEGLHDRDGTEKDRSGGGASKSTILSAIQLAGRVFAVISVAEPRQQRCFDRHDLALLDSIGLFLAKAIQTQQLQGLLDSRLVQLALTQSVGRAGDRVRMESVPHLDRMTRIVARSFYREMTRAGFGSQQIISAATEIISELSNSLQRYSIRSNSAD